MLLGKGIGWPANGGHGNVLICGDQNHRIKKILEIETYWNQIPGF